MHRIKAVFAVLLTSALMVAFAATPALAQQNQTGLVNVGVDLDNNNILSQNEVIVAVPVGIAANVCGVDVNVLAQQKNNPSFVGCTADADAIADIQPGPFQPQA